MKEYKIVFESGVTETVETGSIEVNDVLEKVVCEDDDGKEIEDFYLKLEHVSAVIPQ